MSAVLPIVQGLVAGSMYAGKQAKLPANVDITSQLGAVKSGIGISRRRVDDLYERLAPLTSKYQGDTTAALEGGRADLEQQKGDYLGAVSQNTDAAKNALRANLYGNTFSGLPDTLRAVREAAAAGSGVDSGAYNNAVTQVGQSTASTLANGERDIQLQGLNDQNTAQGKAFDVFSQLSSKLNDQKLDMLTKVMDTGRSDLIQQTAQQLGLDETETQAVLDILNHKDSQELAYRTAGEANKQELYNSLASIGGKAFASNSSGGK